MALKRQTIRKDPDAKLDFGFDWSSWLATGETITASAWTVPTGITEESKSFSSTATLIWLSGGTAGASYTLQNQITTSASRIDERSFVVMVAER